MELSAAITIISEFCTRERKRSSLAQCLGSRGFGTEALIKEEAIPVGIRIVNVAIPISKQALSYPSHRMAAPLQSEYSGKLVVTAAIAV